MIYKGTRCIPFVFMLCIIFVITGCTKSESLPPEAPPFDVPITQIHDTTFLTLTRDMKNEKRLMAVAYLGWVEGGFSEIKNHITEKSYDSDYPFLKDIDEEHFIKTEGSEIYAVVPCDKDTKLAVYKYEFDSQGTLFATEQLFLEKDGRPILIQGNISEIAPNIMLKAERDGVLTEFAPSLSGMDGKLANADNKVLDFSPYSRMEWFEENEKIADRDFWGDWCCLAQDADGNDLTLILSLSDDKTATYSYGQINNEATERFSGKWEIDKNTGLLNLAMYGGPIGSQEDHYMLELSVSCATNDGNLLLTHKAGMPLVANQIGKRYVFCPAY